ncbi:MAG TPA: cytochrome c3 family protein, partial [Pyrinomonadaceae bacterium]|nr:cytochrome c3 family protein [Pyrinomonadaceae bacterium]
MKQLTTAASVVALLLMMSFNVTGEGSILLPQGRRAQKIDYSQFSHRTHVEKQKLACDSCHKFPTTNWKDVRPGDAAFPDVAEFPEHTSCLSCHRRQFFARQRPAPAICSNCHVNMTPRDTARFMFPSLGDVANCSQRKRNVAAAFAVEFPHDKHEDQECVACHQLDKEGEVKTKPNNHSVCFSCHNVESELPPAPSTCNACHKSIKVSQANQPTRYREVVLTVSNSAPWDDGARLGQGQYHHAVLLTVSNLDSAIGNSQYHHAVLLTASNLDSAIGNSQYHHAVAGGSEQRMKVSDDADFSKFQHTSEYHQRMPCLLCHRR